MNNRYKHVIIKKNIKINKWIAFTIIQEKKFQKNERKKNWKQQWKKYLTKPSRYHTKPIKSIFQRQKAL